MFGLCRWCHGNVHSSVSFSMPSPRADQYFCRPKTQPNPPWAALISSSPCSFGTRKYEPTPSSGKPGTGPGDHVCSRTVVLTHTRWSPPVDDELLDAAILQIGADRWRIKRSLARLSRTGFRWARGGGRAPGRVVPRFATKQDAPHRPGNRRCRSCAATNLFGGGRSVISGQMPLARCIHLKPAARHAASKLRLAPPFDQLRRVGKHPGRAFHRKRPAQKIALHVDDSNAHWAGTNRMRKVQPRH